MKVSVFFRASQGSIAVLVNLGDHNTVDGINQATPVGNIQEIYQIYRNTIIQIFGKSYVKSRSFIAFVGQRTPPEALRTICEPPGPSFGFASFSYMFSNCVFLQNHSYLVCFRDNSTTKMQPRGVRSYYGFIKTVDFVLFFYNSFFHCLGRHPIFVLHV